VVIRIDRRADAQGVAQVVGRARELGKLSRFLDAAVAGPSMLVLEGEPGIGKTTLWQACVDAAGERSYCTLVCRPAEAEAKLGYAALADLLETVPEETFAGLADPQRRALDIALLRVEPQGERADRRTVSVALLNVLRSLAEVMPVLVAIDDAQWLDTPSSQAVAFALRRLDQEPVGVVFSMRSGATSTPSFFGGKPEMRVERLNVGPLPPDELGRVVAGHLGLQLSRAASMRVHRASGGNPFYAIEIARGLPRDNPIAGEHLAVPPSLRALVAERVTRLPDSTRRALLVAAALSTPDVATIAAATGRRDGRSAALARAEADGVIRVDAGVVTFAHPLLAASVYGEASPPQRREAHRRIARVVEDPEERAKHLALAAGGPNEEGARVLDDAAQRASTRGAPDEAAMFAESAVRLTPPAQVDDRWRRQVDAARYHELEGESGRARELLDEVVAMAPGGVTRGWALHRLARVTNSASAARALQDRAREDAAGDPRLLAAVERALAEQAMLELEPAEAARHARAQLEFATRSGDDGLRALALTESARVEFLLGHGISSAAVDEAIALECFCPATPILGLPTLDYAWLLHCDGQWAAAGRLYEELLARARAHGDEPSVSGLLGLLSDLALLEADYDTAMRQAELAYDVARRVEPTFLQAYAALRIALAAAHRGSVEHARAAAAEATAVYEEREALDGRGAAAWPLVFLELSLGRPEAAIAHAAPFVRPLVECGVVEPMYILAFLPDLIEALVATGDLDQAADLTDALERRGRATDRAWALATAGRSRGLLEAAQGRLGNALEELEHALAEHDRFVMPFERARTMLVRGVVQRRAKQRRAARTSLSQALSVFDELGAPLWADRARAELARIGGRASGDELTPTEAQVAARAAAGETNREIADALFMSVKTVEANLSRVYRKLDISSRRQLNETLKQQT